MQKMFTVERKYNWENWTQALGEINIALSTYPNAKIVHITSFSEPVGSNSGKANYGAFVVIEYDDIKQNKSVR